MPDTVRLTYRPRTFELVVNVSGELEGEINDWPPKIQDAIYAALEHLGKKHECMVALISSRCDHDIETGWYIHCWASEVVGGIDYASMSKEAIDLMLMKKGTVQ